jgi:hypothetical protein
MTNKPKICANCISFGIEETNICDNDASPVYGELVSECYGCVACELKNDE